MKKGQGAMEYLMSYGWALIIVLIVGIILWNSGVFDQNSTGSSGFKRVQPSDFAFRTINPSQIVWHNIAGQTLKNVSFAYMNDCVEPLATIGNLGQGAAYQDNITCSTPCTPIGSTLKVDVTVYYTTEDGLRHKETGIIRSQCEPGV